MPDLSFEEAAEGGTWVLVNRKRRGSRIDVPLSDVYDTLRPLSSTDAIDRLIALGWDDEEAAAHLRRTAFKIVGLG